MFSVFSLILYLCQSETSFNGDVRGEGSVQRKGKARSARRLVHLCWMFACLHAVVSVSS